MAQQQPGPRKREYGTTVPLTFDRKIYNHLGQLTSSVSNIPSGNRAGEVGYMHDVVTPGYKKRIAAGEIINNAMNRSTTICVAGNGPITLFNANNSRVEYSGLNPFTEFYGGAMPSVDHFDGFNIPGASDDDSCRHEAVIKALGRVAGPDALVLVSIAEVKKTVGLITGTVGTMVDGISTILRGGSKGAVLKLLGVAGRKAAKDTDWAAKTLAGKWLEVRYGWTPLLYDLEGVMNALSRLHFPRITARGFASRSGSKTSTANLTIDASFGHTCVIQTLEKRDVSARAYVLYTVDRRWFLPHYLGALAPLETAWELVPFSFVVDWFVDIGGWLRAIQPRIGVNVLAHGTATRIEYEWSKTCSSHSSGPGSSIVGLLGQKNKYTVKKTQRVTSTDLPLVPPIDVNINVKRAIDAIGLLVQRYGKAR